MLELLSIVRHSLPSLGQLEEFHLLGIPNAVWEIFREEFPPKGLPRHRLASLLHDGFFHQCSASPVSMYIVKANMFSAGHVFASKVLSKSFSHWSAASGLAFPLKFTGWCFRKSSKLHSLTIGRGSGP